MKLFKITISKANAQGHYEETTYVVAQDLVLIAERFAKIDKIEVIAEEVEILTYTIQD